MSLLKSMHGITNSGKLLYNKITEWLIESGFIKYKYQMSIYYKYVQYGKEMVVLLYIDDCVYCYTSEALGKWFVVYVNQDLTDEVLFHLSRSG